MCGQVEDLNLKLISAHGAPACLPWTKRRSSSLLQLSERLPEAAADKHSITNSGLFVVTQQPSLQNPRAIQSCSDDVFLLVKLKVSVVLVPSIKSQSFFSNRFWIIAENKQKFRIH